MIIKIGTYCPCCNKFINGGSILALDGRPEGVALLEDFQMISFECSNCGTVVYTPDYESMCEIEEGEYFDDED